MDKCAHLLIIFGIMSFIGAVITIYDKRAAQKGKQRISEKALILTGFCGGAIGMYITMHLIRHKTQHPKFMVGLPVCIIFHVAIILAVSFI